LAYTAFDLFVARCRFRAARPHIRAGTRVCDIGSGSHAPFLQSLGAHINLGVGLDWHVAANHALGAASLLQVDITRDLPLASNSFDHVVLLAVLEHLPQPEPVLREALRILAPGGSLVMTWPSAAVDPILWVLTRVGVIKDELGFEQHQPRIPVAALRAMLRRIGFGDMDHGTFELGLNNWLVAFKPT
jgi:SAM-dependent methyltransferase